MTCRQQKGTDRYTGDVVYGTLGRADFQQGMIYNEKGELIWSAKGKFEQIHQREQRVFLESLRAGKYFNNGETSLKSTGLAILGRMSAYTGKKLTWKHLMDSTEDLSPDIYDMGATLPMRPVPQPGITTYK